MFGKIGVGELILILCIVLVVFGPTKLPQVGKSMGQAIKEFRKGATQTQKELNDLMEESFKRTKKKTNNYSCCKYCSSPFLLSIY